MAFGTYQVVSEHSILSAQMKDRDAAMEFLEEETFNSVPEWKESLREVKNLWERRTKGERANGKGRRSQRDHAPSRKRIRRGAVSEKLHEIYLDHKLRMLQKFYVTEKSEKPNEEEDTELEGATSEREESEKGHATATLVEASPPNKLREVSLSCVTDLGDREKVAEMVRRNDRAMERLRDGENWGRPPEKNAGGTTAMGGAVEERVYEVVEKKARDEGGRFLSSLVNGYIESGNEKEACVGWSSWPLDLKFDLLGQGQAQNLILTPPKLLVSTPDPFNIERSLLKVTCEKKKKLVGFGWAQKKVDLTFNSMGQTQFFITPPIFANNRRALQVEKEVDLNFNPMGQAHNFIITPPIFTNTGRALQVVDGLNNKRDQLFNSSPLISKILGRSIIGEEGERSPSSVYLCIEVKALGMYATTTEVFAFIKKVSYKKNRAATTLCFRPKNSAENWAFDPGGSSSISCITGIAKFYSPETTYGGLTTLTLDQFFNNLLLVHGWSILAEEVVKVDIKFINPLQVSISISGATLVCKCSASTDELSSADENELSVKTDNDIDYLRDMSSGNSLFTVSEVDFLLGGGQTTVVQLSVTPKAVGTLEILGIRWKLSDTIVGFHKFELSHPKKNILKGRRKANIMPRFLIVGNQGNMKLEFPVCLTKKIDSVQSDTYANPNIMLNTVFSFPEDTSVQGGTPFLWSLWFRAAVPGDISCIIPSFSFKIWDPGRSAMVLKFKGRLHLLLMVGIKSTLILCIAAKKGKGDGRRNLGACSILCIAWFSCLKPWDPGGNCYTSYTAWSLCFQMWDSGRRPLSLLLAHLEDKVNFEGGSIDEYLDLDKSRQVNRIGKVYSRRGRIGIQAK